MNERIREIAEQAFEITNQEIEAKNEGRQGMDGQLGIMYQTFAELIVRECIVTTLRTHDAEPLDDWEYGYNGGVRAVAGAIREHFGVDYFGDEE